MDRPEGLVLGTLEKSHIIEANFKNGVIHYPALLCWSHLNYFQKSNEVVEFILKD